MPITRICCAFSLSCRIRQSEAQRCVKLCTASFYLFSHLVRHWWYITRDCFDNHSYQYSFQLLTITSVYHTWSRVCVSLTVEELLPGVSALCASLRRGALGFQRLPIAYTLHTRRRHMYKNVIRTSIHTPPDLFYLESRQSPCYTQTKIYITNRVTLETNSRLTTKRSCCHAQSACRSIAVS